MKKIFFLLIIAISISSCSDDDSNSETLVNESSIIGKWMVVDKDRPTGEDFPLWDCEENSYIKFNENGTYLRMKYQLVDNNCIPQNMSDTNMAYTVDGKTLTMTYDDIAFGLTIDPATILELTETKLKMSVNYHDDAQGVVIFTYQKVAN